MRILLTNDDGIDAPGLRAILPALRRMGEVAVVAPSGQRSAVSHSLTLYQPIIATSRGGKLRRVEVAVEGTPADCVRLAFQELCARPPDLVVSGINYGANLGVNVYYSGTVAGAVEGAFFGVPGIALSLEWTPEPDFAGVAKRLAPIVRKLAREYAGQGVAFGVNVPAERRREDDGPVWTRMHPGALPERYTRRTDPRGRTYFWTAMETTWTLRARGNGRVHRPDDPPMDTEAFLSGKISITPLRSDMTDHEVLSGDRRPGRARAKAPENGKSEKCAE